MAAQKPPAWNWKPRAATRATPSRPSRNLPGVELRDFFDFAKLSAELQDMVWACAAQHPATFTLGITKSMCTLEDGIPDSPSLLFATAGSRAVALKFYKLIENEDFKRAADLQVPAPGPMALAPLPGLLPVNNGPPSLLSQIAGIPNPGAGLAAQVLPNVIGTNGMQALIIPPPPPFQPTGAVRRRRHRLFRSGFVVDIPRKRFYINVAREIFKLSVGDTPASYQYPVALVTDEPFLIMPKPHPDIDDAIAELMELYVPPGAFPGTTPLPDFFTDVTRISLDVKLAPIFLHSTAKNDIASRICRAFDDFWTTVKSRMEMFPNLLRVDLVVPGAVEDDSMFKGCTAGNEIRLWRDTKYKRSNGLSFGRIELNLIESQLFCLVGGRNEDRKDFVTSTGEVRQMPVIELCVSVPDYVSTVADERAEIFGEVYEL